MSNWMRLLRSLICAAFVLLPWQYLSGYDSFDWQTWVFLAGSVVSGVLRDAWKIKETP